MSDEILLSRAVSTLGESDGSPAREAILDKQTGESAPSAWRAWCFLVWMSIQRQARIRQMVWIALALLTLMGTVVGLTTAAGGWSMSRWRWRWYAPPERAETAGTVAEQGEKPPLPPPKAGPEWKQPHFVESTYGQTAEALGLFPHTAPGTSPLTMISDSMAGAAQLALRRSAFYVFSNWIVFSVFIGFLLPIWSLSFATEALGGEREGRTLVWLVSRPLSRPAIYLAKFVGVLPWSLVLNLGGFGVLCVLAGPPGRQAFRLYWPAVLGGTLAFCSLFHLMGACFRRAAVVALVYSFFLETILGNMPGYMKRISLSFYTRCLMFDSAQAYGVQPEKPSIYLPVDGPTAWLVLICVSIVLLAAGMFVFARSEYQDLS